MSINPGNRIASPSSMSSPSGHPDAGDPVTVNPHNAGPDNLPGVDVE